MTNKTSQTSKFLSYILRHQPEAIGLTLNPDGWVNIDTLIKQANLHGETLNREIIDEIVQTSDKKRFTISENGQNIRAAQGHSTKQVDIAYSEQKPPEFLYHGTATRFLNSINQQGLLPGSRHYVHLSTDAETATTVGARHGKPVILQINALTMFQAGYKFYLADNGVWLTQTIPAKYFHLYQASLA
ncbi:RNA 2'-phosphotransferase [Snodgrassella alvi]|jgi:putative RNA 2'-phosphotransferase|uniref:Probable RNA 2'-phosphotransferase n=1 Tax=Snodgrassella alvi TaxID=1196083 RepID=A0A2N9XXS5_9NEIS|nr:RNA 2'-phosphotransferase [Snodgrassella alvi]PIT51407.1 RNA 2'-phosphotransferase [Snodgrassella alvi]PIT54878.1 RNA 2'-phosphotransferase [Snodgrassella alvi]